MYEMCWRDVLPFKIRSGQVRSGQVRIGIFRQIRLCRHIGRSGISSDRHLEKGECPLQYVPDDL